MNAALRIECEGSNCPAHFPNFAEGMCAMCGAWVPLLSDGKAIRHSRLDVLGMVMAPPTQYEEKE